MLTYFSSATISQDPNCANPAMALKHRTSSTTVKAVVLPSILMLLAIAAAAPSIAAAPIVKAATRGRFSETPLGRRLLNSNGCGSGSAPNYNCAAILPFAFKPACCTDVLQNKLCWDVGAFLLDKCGSCTTTCPFGSICCSGVCANLLTDKNNCGFCGNKCANCVFGLCKYG